MRRKTRILTTAIDKLCEELDRCTEYFVQERPFLLSKDEIENIPDLDKKIEENKTVIKEMICEIQKLLG